ncbi:Nn.00g113140.m01.CDS01 [Neocucurbitaria sp. VM-36]
MRVLFPLALLVTLAFAIPQSAADYRGGSRPPRPRPHKKCVKYWDLCHKDWDTCDTDDGPPDAPYDFTKVIEYARSAPSCNPVLCLGVLAVAPCIDKALQENDGDAVEQCSSDICECTGCIEDLDQFREQFDMCDRH